MKILWENNIFSSSEGAMALAALLKAWEGGYDFENPIVLITG